MMLESLAVLNNNKIIWGLTMILLNMGSKYVMADLGKAHERLLQNEWFKKIVLFSMFFVATRDLVTTFLLTVLYIIIVDGILHENRNFAVVRIEGAEVRTTADETDVYAKYLSNVNALRMRS